MSSENKIIIISDNITAKERLLNKINLMRNSDVLESYSYNNVTASLSATVPELIILYSDIYNTSCFAVLNEIKSSTDFLEVPILLVCEKIDQNFILNAFDEGISDYISIDATDSEFLMRIIWCLQKNSLLQKYYSNLEQLVEMNVVCKDTYFYKDEFVDSVFQSKIKKMREKNIESSLVILTASIDCKQKLTPYLLGSILKDTIRKTDTVGIKDEDKFFILLKNAGDNDIKAFAERIKNELMFDYGISIGVAHVVGADYERAKEEAQKALSEALEKKGELVIYSGRKNKFSKNSSDEEEDLTVPHKNFKLFKQSFLKKLNNVITPVFFQVQKMWEEKLFETKIEQITSEGKSMFTLSSKKYYSTLSITYPGFSKINIKKEHQSLDKNDVKTLSLNLSELDTLKLTKVLENFIKEYKEISGN